MPLIHRCLFAIVVMWALAGSAEAQTCSVSISDLSFASVDVIAGGSVDTTATLAISCSGVPLTSVRICPHIQQGSGGADATSRYLAGPGGATLAFQIYRDAARTMVWGSGYWALPGDPPTIVLPLGLSGSANTNITLYGRIQGGQASAPAGFYSSGFTGSETTVDYGLEVVGLLDCGALPLLGQTTTAPFTASATVEENCLVNADDISFGTQGVLTANVDANGQVLVTCTTDTSYTVELDNGLSGAGPAARGMTNGPGTIAYGLFKDAARVQPWGDAGTPGSSVSGTGSGASQSLTVYGRVPAQNTPAPGTYTDTIVVTLTY